MRAGTLDRVVTLDRVTVTVDANGTPQQAWTTYATMRAELLTNSTKEQALKSFGEDTDIARVWRMRWIDGVLLADRVTYAGASYRIVAITELGRREGLEIGGLLVTA
jgi:head-tail adaptor